MLLEMLLASYIERSYGLYEVEKTAQMLQVS